MDKLGESSAVGVVEAVEPQVQADPRGGNPTDHWPSATNKWKGRGVARERGLYGHVNNVEWDIRKPKPPYAYENLGTEASPAAYQG